MVRHLDPLLLNLDCVLQIVLKRCYNAEEKRVESNLFKPQGVVHASTEGWHKRR